MRIRFKPMDSDNYIYATVIDKVNCLIPDGTGYLIQIDGIEEDRLFAIRECLCEIIEED